MKQAPPVAPDTEGTFGMRKILLGGAASLAVLAGVLISPAQAQCNWTGFGWNCAGPYYGQPSAAWTYPGAGDWWTGGLGYYGSAEQYASSRNGPDPGGGFRHIGRSNIGHTD